jgi:hypothetical protein
MRHTALMFLGLLACPLAAAAPTQSAPTPPPIAAQANAIDGNVRRDVVAKLSDALRDNYIFPDVGQKAAEKISGSLAAGEYDNLADPGAFAAQLSADVAAIAHDKHMSVSSMSGPPPSPGGLVRAMPRSEAGIVRADKLAGGVGYIEVVGFPPLPAFKSTVDKAMSVLKGSRAVIIDVRRNMGGSPDAVGYLVSYLIPSNRSIEINDIVSRVPKTNNFDHKKFFSTPTPVNFAKIPVYVLTSKNTFSGGEEFAYDVQTHKLGKIVGEVTGGGANPTGPVDLGHGFVASIPWGRAENPITKTNWEGRGVQPDINVPAPDALKVALTRLGQNSATDIATASLKQVFAPRSTPLPGSETATRQFIAGLVSGNPDYASMTAEFASFNREHLPMLRQTFLLPLGELRSIKFEDVGMMGGDEYRASFANGAIIVAVALDANGKVAGAQMRPAPAGQ